MTFDEDSKILEVTPISDADYGFYVISIKIYEEDAPIMSNSYNFDITVLPVSESEPCLEGLCGLDGTPFLDRY